MQGARPESTVAQYDYLAEQLLREPGGPEAVLPETRNDQNFD